MLDQTLKISEKQKPRIGVRRMGELDTEPFWVAIKRAGHLQSKDEIEVQASGFWSEWNWHLRDPHWWPFKVVEAEAGGSHKRVIDEHDEKLKSLKKDVGLEAYEAVTTALMELAEYNPSGRYPTLRKLLVDFVVWLHYRVTELLLLPTTLLNLQT